MLLTFLFRNETHTLTCICILYKVFHVFTVWIVFFVLVFFVFQLFGFKAKLSQPVCLYHPVVLAVVHAFKLLLVSGIPLVLEPVPTLLVDVESVVSRGGDPILLLGRVHHLMVKVFVHFIVLFPLVKFLWGPLRAHYGRILILAPKARGV